MGVKDVELAKLSAAELEEIKQIEEKLTKKLERNVALVAFESVEDYVPAEMDEEQLAKIKDLEKELTKDNKIALVAFEHKA